jgi:uncharacterized damage-inducible protein DinB
MKTQLLSTIENLLATIENSRGYTLAVAEAMPEDRYDFKPASAVWNFLELMNHIIYGINWYKENYIQKTKTPWEPPAPHKTKTATIKNLEQSFVALKKVLNSIDLDEERIHGVYTTLDHVTHHRGQATTYLRCNGIKPAEYIY